MKRGKYQTAKVRKKTMRRRKLNKYFLVTISLVLLLGIVGGATLAYIIAEGETVSNSFTPGSVVCVVNDDFTVTNSGNTAAFVRAAVIVNWESSSGDINGIAPAERVDYTITPGAGWTKGSDGYYYYGSSLAAGTSTPKVASVQKITSLEGFDLDVVVLGEAIQADGMGAASAQAAWSVAAGNS